MELVWRNATIKRKVKLNSSNNRGIIWSAPDYKKYSKFIAMSGTANNINSEQDNRMMTARGAPFENDTSNMDPITPFNFEPNVPIKGTTRSY